MPSSTCSATYAVEPTRPASSAPQKAKRSRLRGCPGRSAISSAISRIVEVPEPLSLMPGPSSTESRWAPITIVRPRRPSWLSAITLSSVFGVMVESTAKFTDTGPAWASV